MLRFCKRIGTTIIDGRGNEFSLGEKRAMVSGIGVDIVDIRRFRDKVCRTGERLLERLFCLSEIDAVGRGPRRLEKLAGRFAAKEAVLKAMGTGLRGMTWKQVIIYSDEGGAPRVRLEGKAREVAANLRIADFMVSISHSGGYCVACAIAIMRPDP